MQGATLSPAESPKMAVLERGVMGTIFVAYGEPGQREIVLEFAIEQAAACDHDVLVYHVQESPEESEEQIREEITTVVQRTASQLAVEVQIDSPDEFSDRTNVSTQKRLTDAIFETDRDFEYVVMGAVQRGSLEELSHSSTTKAVLKAHTIPVMLVPV